MTHAIPRRFFVLLLACFWIPLTHADTASLEVFSKTYETDHFHIHYSDDLESVSPSSIDIVAAAAEMSWEILTTNLDYPEPVLDDLGKVDLYLDDQEVFLPDGAIGVAGYLGADDTLSMAVYPLMSEGLMQVTTAHEFFHLIQYTLSPSGLDLYLAESTAVWAEEQVYDEVNDYIYSYLNDYFQYPDYSIFGSYPPSDTLYEYSSSIWPIYLSEQLGPSVIQAVWFAYGASDLYWSDPEKAYLSYEDAISSMNEDLDELYVQFSLWNLDPSSHYEEGDLYEENSSLFVLNGIANQDWVEVSYDVAPASYGTNYIYFENLEHEDAFSFYLEKPDGVRFDISFIPVENGEIKFNDLISKDLDSHEIMDEALEYSQTSDFDGFYLVINALSSENRDFDMAYPYQYMASFGTDLALPNMAFDFQALSFGEDWVQLDWANLGDPGIVSYEIQYTSESDSVLKKELVEHSYQTALTLYGLTPGETYEVQVQALDIQGDPYLDPSEVIEVSPKAWIFTDVSYDDPLFEAISFVKDYGIFEGYPDGSFKPDQILLRAELLKVLIETLNVTPDASIYKNCFPDVTDQWFAPYVCYAKEQGYVQGDLSDGYFHPEREVNKVEALKMILEVFGIADYFGVNEGPVSYELPYPDLDSFAWYASYVDLAWSLDVLIEPEGDDFLPEAGRERGDMALQIMLSYDYIQAEPPSLDLIEIEIEMPDSVSSGEEFEISVSLTNNDSIPRYFYSLDLGKTFVDAVEINCYEAELSCMGDDFEYTYNGLEYIALDYLWYLSPGETLTVDLPVYAIEPGTYSFPFDVCMDENGNNCIETMQEIVISECPQDDWVCPYY